jgi:hypothetical protein
MVQDLKFAAKVAALAAATTILSMVAFAAIDNTLTTEARAECARLRAEADRWEDQVLPAWCEDIPPAR